MTAQTQTKKDSLTLEDALLSLNLISPTQLELVKLENVNTGKPLEQILREMNLVGSESIARAWSLVYNLPYVSLLGQNIPSQVLHKIPEQVCRNYNIVPFGMEGEGLRVAIEDPKNLQALEVLEFLKKRNNYDISLYIASTDSINHALSQFGTLTTEVAKTLKEIKPQTLDEEAATEEITSAEELGKVIQDAPISKVVAVIIKYAVTARASDIHIEPQENDLRVRYRIDGILHQTVSLPKSVQAAIVSRIKILSNLKIDEQRIPQDGRFATHIGDKEIDFRVSTFPTANGEKVVMRLLDKSATLIDIRKLGLTDRNLEVLRRESTKPYGMVLVTGPTGSGKTTTLYAALEELNKEGVNVLTIEDPIEYFIPGINQSQVKPDVGYTFASGLRSMLRQDPDIVLVGEIRDNETAEMAVHAALTGHLVLSTLHTNDASGALPRLIDMEVEPFLIASSLNLVIAQRLVRTICKDCKQEYNASPQEKNIIAQEVKKMPEEEQKKLKVSSEIRLFRGKGCAKCQDTGYQGRIALYETLPVSESIEELAVKHAKSTDIKNEAIKEGMLTLKQDGILKALLGTTTLSEVERVTAE